ncbi:ABC transporter substrate-binding protein [Candidatus Pantoea edessiphila]
MNSKMILKCISVIFVLAFTNVQAKTLVYCSEGSPKGFNPQLFTSNTTYDASSVPIYNRLIEFKQGTTELQPGLAESWDVNSDGKVYTFNLRKGVKWQSTKYFKPTREFNADDVIFSFERQLYQKNKYHKVSGGQYKYFENMGMAKLINKIEKIDTYKVKFFLSKPWAPFVSNLAMDFSSILSKEYADNLLKTGTPEKIDTNPVGTGPFQLLRYKKNVRIIYKVNPNYWGTKPKIDHLIFSIIPNPSLRYAKIKQGVCHVMAYPNRSDLQNVKENKNIKIANQIGLNVSFLSFNTTSKPINKLEVRKALAMAINREAIINSIYKDNSRISDSLIPPVMWGYNKLIKNYEYNPIKARNILSKVGLKNGFSIDLWTLSTNQQECNNTEVQLIASMIKSDWAKIGVKTKIINYSWHDYLKHKKNDKYQSIVTNWSGENGDPDNFFSNLFKCDPTKYGFNYSNWCYKPFNEKINSARTSISHSKRIDFYRHAHMIMHNQIPILVIKHAKIFEPISDKVIGYTVDPFGKHHFDNVDIKE